MLNRGGDAVKKSGRQDRIIVALDTQDFSEMKRWVKSLKGLISFFKVGSELFTACGKKAVKYVRDQGAEVFLDLKFHDIPATVEASAKAAAGLGVKMFNVHALGGVQMMRAAKQAVKDISPMPWVLGVTVLTSMGENELSDELKIAMPLERQVIHLAKLAKQSGLDGVVASAREVKHVKKILGGGFKVVTPGIRPAWSASQDQKRIVTPRDAFALGTDYIVIGRPITGAKDVKGAALRVIEEIE
ncbi:MAG TPA: orotidine-5'-phosphate decarboxylase [Candidatus Omnitrophota bacterium]|nr:orotidine-5'-phosphate decarboxylase [Candidatus Omnitrophota bacterium]